MNETICEVCGVQEAKETTDGSGKVAAGVRLCVTCFGYVPSAEVAAQLKRRSRSAQKADRFNVGDRIQLRGRITCGTVEAVDLTDGTVKLRCDPRNSVFWYSATELEHLPPWKDKQDDSYQSPGVVDADGVELAVGDRVSLANVRHETGTVVEFPSRGHWEVLVRYDRERDTMSRGAFGVGLRKLPATAPEAKREVLQSGIRCGKTEAFRRMCEELQSVDSGLLGLARAMREVAYHACVECRAFMSGGGIAVELGASHQASRCLYCDHRIRLPDPVYSPPVEVRAAHDWEVDSGGAWDGTP